MDYSKSLSGLDSQEVEPTGALETQTTFDSLKYDSDVIEMPMPSVFFEEPSDATHDFASCRYEDQEYFHVVLQQLINYVAKYYPEEDWLLAQLFEKSVCNAALLPDNSSEFGCTSDYVEDQIEQTQQSLVRAISPVYSSNDLDEDPHENALYAGENNEEQPPELSHGLQSDSVLHDPSLAQSYGYYSNEYALSASDMTHIKRRYQLRWQPNVDFDMYTDNIYPDFLVSQPTLRGESNSDENNWNQTEPAEELPDTSNSAAQYELYIPTEPMQEVIDADMHLLYQSNLENMHGHWNYSHYERTNGTCLEAGYFDVNAGAYDGYNGLYTLKRCLMARNRSKFRVSNVTVCSSQLRRLRCSLSQNYGKRKRTDFSGESVGDLQLNALTSDAAQPINGNIGFLEPENNAAFDAPVFSENTVIAESSAMGSIQFATLKALAHDLEEASSINGTALALQNMLTIASTIQPNSCECFVAIATTPVSYLAHRSPNAPNGPHQTAIGLGGPPQTNALAETFVKHLSDSLNTLDKTTKDVTAINGAESVNWSKSNLTEIHQRNAKQQDSKKCFEWLASLPTDAQGCTIDTDSGILSASSSTIAASNSLTELSKTAKNTASSVLDAVNKEQRHKRPSYALSSDSLSYETSKLNEFTDSSKLRDVTVDTAESSQAIKVASECKTWEHEAETKLSNINAETESLLKAISPAGSVCALAIDNGTAKNSAGCGDDSTRQFDRKAGGLISHDFYAEKASIIASKQRLQEEMAKTRALVEQAKSEIASLKNDLQTFVNRPLDTRKKFAQIRSKILEDYEAEKQKSDYNRTSATNLSSIKPSASELSTKLSANSEMTFSTGSLTAKDSAEQNALAKTSIRLRREFVKYETSLNTELEYLRHRFKTSDFTK